MYFPSLSIITTLACAAFSVAAPLSDAPASLENAAASIKEKFQNIPRDLPAAPAAPPASAPKVSLSTTFTDLLTVLDPVVTEIKGAANVEVKTEVSTANVVAAVEKLVPILQAALARVQVIADDPENYVVSDENIGPVVGTVAYTVIQALATAVTAVGTAQDTLLPLVAQIGNLLGETVFLVVTKIVPSTLDAVVEKVRPVVGQIYVLNIAGIAETLGLKPPMT